MHATVARICSKVIRLSAKAVRTIYGSSRGVVLMHGPVPGLMVLELSCVSSLINLYTDMTLRPVVLTI